jgi:citrate lyase subunit beta/citryl-CoA lyase
VLAAPEVAAFPGVVHLAIGGVDLRRDLNCGTGDLPTLYARSRLVLASRAAGIAPPIDSVYPYLDDEAGLRRETQLARSLGFFGKSAIHPPAAARRARGFTPSAEELRWAEDVVATFEDAGDAAVSLAGGEFVDLPVARRARRLLELAASLSRT